MIPNFKDQNFLQLAPIKELKSTVVRFYSTDTEEGYINNLKWLDNDWHYRTKPVSYQLNSFGYRTVEFSQVDWQNSIVVFGCSNVFGVGVAEDETVCHYITEITGVPAINFGIPGSSIHTSFVNALILREHYPTPAGVVNIWTSPDRLSIYDSCHYKTFGSWSDSAEYEMWNKTDFNSKMYALSHQYASKFIWKSITRYTELTYFKHTASILGCNLIDFHNTYARDCLHPGPVSHKNAAIAIVEQLGL